MRRFFIIISFFSAVSKQRALATANQFTTSSLPISQLSAVCSLFILFTLLHAVNLPVQRYTTTTIVVLAKNKNRSGGTWKMKQFLESVEKCQSSVERCARNTRSFIFVGFFYVFECNFLKKKKKKIFLPKSK